MEIIANEEPGIVVSNTEGDKIMLGNSSDLSNFIIIKNKAADKKKKKMKRIKVDDKKSQVSKERQEWINMMDNKKKGDPVKVLKDGSNATKEEVKAVKKEKLEDDDTNKESKALTDTDEQIKKLDIYTDGPKHAEPTTTADEEEKSVGESIDGDGEKKEENSSEDSNDGDDEKKDEKNSEDCNNEDDTKDEETMSNKDDDTSRVLLKEANESIKVN